MISWLRKGKGDRPEDQRSSGQRKREREQRSESPERERRKKNGKKTRKGRGPRANTQKAKKAKKGGEKKKKCANLDSAVIFAPLFSSFGFSLLFVFFFPHFFTSLLFFVSRLFSSPLFSLFFLFPLFPSFSPLTPLS